MSGDYFGYDGPAPPWNDARAHHYIFTLYAPEACRSLEVEGTFNGKQVLSAIQGTILAQASVTGMYTLNRGAGAQQIGTYIGMIVGGGCLLGAPPPSSPRYTVTSSAPSHAFFTLWRPLHPAPHPGAFFVSAPPLPALASDGARRPRPEPARYLQPHAVRGHPPAKLAHSSMNPVHAKRLSVFPEIRFEVENARQGHFRQWLIGEKRRNATVN